MFSADEHSTLFVILYPKRANSRDDGHDDGHAQHDVHQPQHHFCQEIITHVSHCYELYS